MADRLMQVTAGAICLIAMVSVMQATPRPLQQQPFPDAAEYADSARHVSRGDGYITFVHGGSRQPPRYPPGFALALAPFSVVGEYPSNVQRGATAYALFYVLAMIVAAWALGGPLAGAVVGGVVFASPFARESASLIMSDGLVAGITVLALPLVNRMTREGERLAGALMGVAMLVRLTAGIGLVAVLAASPRRSLGRVLLWSAPFVLGLALLQWAMFGSPLRTGYDYWGLTDHTFSPAHALSDTLTREGPFIFSDRLDGRLMNWVCPCPIGGSQAGLANGAFYPALLAGAFWVFGPPLFPLLGLAYAWRRRRDPVGRYALVLVFLSLVVFVFYFYQGTRFLAGPASVLEVLAGVAVAGGLRQLARRWAHAEGRPAGSSG